MKPIALYLIGGFLGAGKTTFLSGFLKGLSDKRVGLLVNEFGSVGVDGVLLERDGIQMVEVNNGSIFCACLREGFVRTLKAFSQQPIDCLLIEHSGMADPGSMNTLLRGLAPYLERPYEYRGLICLVDSVTFLEYVDLFAAMENQVAAADLLLVNKIDLVSREQVGAIHQRLRELNDAAAIYDTMYGSIPPAILDGCLINHGWSCSSSNRPDNRPVSYTLEAPGIQAERETLEEFCRRLAPCTLRIKGFFPSGEQCWLHIEAVGAQITVLQYPRQENLFRLAGKLVLIGRSQAPFADTIMAAWRELFGAPARLVSDEGVQNI